MKKHLVAKKHRVAKKMTVPSIGFLTVALIVILASTLATAPDTVARPSCDCVGNYDTAEQWGHGSSCSIANQDLYAQAFSQAENHCGVGNVCNAALVITLGCQEHPVGSGDYMIDGYINHGCCVGEM